jgi:hypothetical protein
MNRQDTDQIACGCSLSQISRGAKACPRYHCSRPGRAAAGRSPSLSLRRWCRIWRMPILLLEDDGFCSEVDAGSRSLGYSCSISCGPSPPKNLAKNRQDGTRGRVDRGGKSYGSEEEASSWSSSLRCQCRRLTYGNRRG